MSDQSRAAGVGPDREHFLAVLNDITFAALEIQDFDELLQLLADRLAEIIRADGCYLTLWREETQTTIPVAAHGTINEFYRKISLSPGEPTITKAVVDAGKTLIIGDAWNTKYASPILTRKFPSRSLLGIPIRIADRKLGAALISFNHHHEFTREEIDYCEQAVRQVSLAIANTQTMTALKRSEQEYKLLTAELQKRDEHMKEAQHNARMGSWEQGAEPGSTHWSQGMFTLFNLPIETRPPSKQQLLEKIAPADRDYMRAILGKPELAGSISPLEFRTVHGKHLFGEVFIDEVNKRVMGTLHDVTEQRLLEAELHQARKMEAVGTLAGGIAHNFNNILTVIMGNYELLSHSIPDDSREKQLLTQCLKATERAAQLTRQLLVVSRKHELDLEIIDSNNLVDNMVVLLAPLVGEHITLRTQLDGGPTYVNADRGYLEQVLMNLVLNARDAMPNGGTLTILTEHHAEDANSIAIRVIDEGIGIEERDLPHIFDPFFTTKDEGKGTGLGLATVQSIIQQSHGRVEVASEPGKGSEFTVFLPAATPVASTAADRENIGPVAVSKVLRNATILLVEDNESLRNVATFVLEKADYQVVSCADGHEAFEQVARGIKFDLLLTDMQLPGGISGREIALRVTTHRPYPIIFMSGLRDELGGTPAGRFLAKPFRPQELLDAVDQTLNDFYESAPTVS